MAGGRLLAGLGVTRAEEELYRFLLRCPRSRRADAAAVLNLDRDEVESAFEGLQRHGLVREGDDQAFLALDPAVAVEKLIDGRLQLLNREILAVSAARSVIPSLIADLQSGRHHGGSEEIEPVEGLANIRARLDDLAFFAHDEVLAFQPDGPLTQGYIDAARPLDLRCLRRGVAMRTVVLRSAADDPATESYLRELVALGLQLKVVEDAMERMLVYDRRTAVVPMDPADSARGALVIRQASLVANMVSLFEQVWSAAAAFDAGVETTEEAAAVTVLERQVLSILAKASKDEIAAREMGVSVRTFRRHVADLMLRLGASNRFQAALLAQSRGWI